VRRLVLGPRTAGLLERFDRCFASFLELRQARAMIAAGEPKAAVARTLRIGRTTLYRQLATAENLDQAG
jgi:DNA-binding phage protein